MRGLILGGGALLALGSVSGPEGRTRRVPMKRGYSLADGKHTHEGEKARRKRQAVQIDANRRSRARDQAIRTGRPYPAPNIGLTRTGKTVLLRHYPGAPE